MRVHDVDIIGDNITLHQHQHDIVLLVIVVIWLDICWHFDPYRYRGRHFCHITLDFVCCSAKMISFPLVRRLFHSIATFDLKTKHYLMTRLTIISLVLGSPDLRLFYSRFKTLNKKFRFLFSLTDLVKSAHIIWINKSFQLAFCSLINFPVLSMILSRWKFIAFSPLKPICLAFALTQCLRSMKRWWLCVRSNCLPFSCAETLVVAQLHENPIDLKHCYEFVVCFISAFLPRTHFSCLTLLQLCNCLFASRNN